MPAFFLGVAAGFLTVLAPCILPVLPFLLGTSGGRSKWRPLFIILGFVASFSVVGAALATAGSLFGISNAALRAVAVVLLFAFGLALLFEGVYSRMTAKLQSALVGAGARISSGAAAKTDALSGILVGVSLGLIWTPCAGPILGAILTIAARTKDLALTAALLFAYALGAGVPMLAIAYGGRAIQARLKNVGALQPALNKIFGLLIIGAAIAVWTGYDLVLLAEIAKWYPAASSPKL